jgi:hypothetical protein
VKTYDVIVYYFNDFKLKIQIFKKQPSSANRIAMAVFRFVCQYYPAMKMERRIAISAAPSTKAAIRIIPDLISPDASGCLAIASIAFPPTIPIPIPAPITANPAPTAANVPVMILVYYGLKKIFIKTNYSKK